jgi:hypothetical protein
MHGVLHADIYRPYVLTKVSNNSDYQVPTAFQSYDKVLLSRHAHHKAVYNLCVELEWVIRG